MLYPKNITKFLSLLVATSFLLPNIASANVFALGNGSISISPSASQVKANDPLTKGWVIETMNPGDQVQRKITISNSTDEEKVLLLSEEDYYAGDQGTYSYTDKEDNKSVGNWLKLENKNITLPPKKSTEVGFSITVPKDIKPGEYSGVIALQEAPNDSEKGTLSFVSRLSTRIYITVPGDLQTGVKFNEFKFVTPDANYTAPEKYQAFLKANYNLPAENIFIALNYTNTGNIFNRLRGNIEVTNPDGVVSKSGFNRDLGYGEGDIAVPYLMLDEAKWAKPGKYKAKYSFTNEALITSNKTDVKNLTAIQTVETEFDITQVMIDQFKTDLDKSKVAIDNPAATNNKKKEDSSLSIKQKENSTNSENENNSSESSTSKDQNTILIAGSAVIITLLIIILAFILYKKFDKKSKSKSPKDELTKDETAK